MSPSSFVSAVASMSVTPGALLVCSPSTQKYSGTYVFGAPIAATNLSISTNVIHRSPSKSPMSAARLHMSGYADRYVLM